MSGFEQQNVFLDSKYQVCCIYCLKKDQQIATVTSCTVTEKSMSFFAHTSAKLHISYFCALGEWMQNIQYEKRDTNESWIRKLSVLLGKPHFFLFVISTLYQHQKGCSWNKRDGCFTWPKAIKNSFFPICHWRVLNDPSVRLAVNWGQYLHAGTTVE